MQAWTLCPDQSAAAIASLTPSSFFDFDIWVAKGLLLFLKVVYYFCAMFSGRFFDAQHPWRTSHMMIFSSCRPFCSFSCASLIFLCNSVTFLSNYVLCLFCWMTFLILWFYSNFGIYLVSCFVHSVRRAFIICSFSQPDHVCYHIMVKINLYYAFASPIEFLVPSSVLWLGLSVVQI